MSRQSQNDFPESGKYYWKSLDGMTNTPEFRSWVEREFPEGASMLDGVQRRGFMKVMAASFSLAGLGMTGCRRPEHTILPYGKSPEELIPGIPNFYSTSMPTSQGFNPLIVESHEGRPTKVEGNPSYIPFRGGTDIYAQASVLDIYDPDRARGSFRKEVAQNGSSSSTRWRKVSSAESLEEISKWPKNKKLAFLSDSSFSLARKKLKDSALEKGIQWFEYDAIDFRKPEKDLASAFGLDENLRPVPDFNKCSRGV